MEFHPKRRNFELVRAILKILIACSVSRVELSHKYRFVGGSINEKKLAHGTNPLPPPQDSTNLTGFIYK